MAMMTTVEKILAKAQELEQQAAALRLAASLIGGEVHARKGAAVASQLAAATALRQAQRASNGHGYGANGNGAGGHVETVVPDVVPPPARGRRRTPQTLQAKAARAEKRQAVVAIVRDYGQAMPLKELVAAAREQGIDSLTGMQAYVRAGYLKQGGRKGKTRYTFVRMPE